MIIGGIVTVLIRRRRRQKVILDSFAGSNIHTQKELDTYINTTLAGLRTETLLRSQMSPARLEVKDLLNLVFTPENGKL